MNADGTGKKENLLIKEILQKDSPERREIHKLLKNFSSTLRKIPLYPAAHPMVKDSITELGEGLRKFFSQYGDLTLDVMDGNMLLCGRQLDDAGGTARDLIADLKKLRIEGLVLEPGINTEEIEKFLRLLTQKPEVIEEKGGIKKLIADEQMHHVKISEVHYARITEDEEIRDKDAPAQTPAYVPGTGEDNKDIVSRVSDFLGGNSAEIPQKETLMFEFKKHARSLVRQLLKLIGPEKAIEEVLKIIEERFAKAGLSAEEQQFCVEKIKAETIRLRQPKISKKELESRLKALMKENEALKEKSGGLNTSVQDQVQQATAQLQEENRRIKKEKERINTVLKNVADGLVIVDNDGKVLLLNPAAENLLGVNKEEKVGKNILEGLRDEHMVSFAREKKQEIEIELAGPDNSAKKTLRASTAVIENEQGQTVGMVSVLSDITKQKELDRLKDTFVSNVSHELRAPLISIQKSLALVIEQGQETLLPQQKRFLEIAANNAKRLAGLINDLLDISKLEAGHVKPQLKRVCLKTVVDEVFELLSVWASTRGVSLLEEGLETAQVDADAALLNQVFTNLIGNAVKFTPGGGSVTVRAQIRGHEAEISVADTGCGIPAQSLERIFNKFEQVKTITSGESKGTGLGLAIVREIIELHGGRIWAESEEGKGSRFIIVLPKEREVMDLRD